MDAVDAVDVVDVVDEAEEVDIVDEADEVDRGEEAGICIGSLGMMAGWRVGHLPREAPRVAGAENGSGVISVI